VPARLAWVAAVALLVQPLAAVGAHEAAADDGSVSQAAGGSVSADLSPEAAASKKAADSGEPVEVATDTTPTERVVAHPDGTFTLEATTSPVRAEQNGTWVPLDTTLQALGNLIRPKAAAVDVAFSAGGASTPLATVTSNGMSYSIAAPWALPAPTISGSTVTYASVLPDVDLVVAAVPDGFTENVVVKTRAAAQNPDLATLRFPITMHGLRVQEGSSGSAALVDGAGRPVFTSGSAVQWDSSPAAAAPAAGQTGGPSALAEPADATQEPAPGSKTVAMDVSINATAMTVIPDQQFLADPATVYPVVLDPQTTKGSLTGWTALWSNESTTSFWKTTHSLGVGYDAYVDNKKVESLYQFDTHGVAGKKILGATFTAEEVWSANCTAKYVDLWRTTAISSTTTWSKHPTWQAKVDSVPAAKGHSSSCPGGNVSFNATSAVASTAAASSATTTLGLKADESDPIAWKQFASPADTVPVLSITFVSAPSAPTSVRVSNPNVGCATTWQNPAVIRDTTPTLSAAPKSSDGSQATLRPDFRVIDIAPSPDVTIASGSPSAWTASGTAGTWTPSALVTGKIYAFVARSEYHYSWNGLTGSMYSSWTNYCYFKIDTTAPPPPGITPVTSTVTYLPCASEDDPDSCTAYGGVGAPGSFKITAGASDVVKYVYTLNGEAAFTKTFTTGTPTFTPPALVPDVRGVNTLDVTTYDSAGNASESGHYAFKVAAGASPVDSWSFNEGSGTTAADSAGGNTATLASGAAWSNQARLGTAFQGNGTTAYAASTTSAVDTSTSFTVSAWVRLSSLAANSTFLAQRGANADGFQLYYSTLCGWAFNRHSADVTDPVIIATCVPATANVWTHLLGVYDAQAQKLKLYVNGVNDPTKDVAFTTPWKATGPVDFGRRLYKGTFGEYVQGSLDEVQIWNRIMSPQEIDDLQAMTDPATGKARPQPAASWAMADAVGSTAAADSSGYGHTATVGSGASFAQDADGGMGSVLSLDGTANAYASAVGPVVDAKGGFTVSAWVNLDPTAFTDAAARTMRIVSQTGTNSDTWGLWYQKAAGQSQGSWVFGRSAADTVGAATTTAPQSVTAAALVDPGGWTLLTGVYDSAAQEMYLYVNGVQQGINGSDEGDDTTGDGTVFTTSWQASGPLLIGSGHTSAGVVGDATTGEVAKARVWIGTTSPTDILQMWVDEVPILI
jgi:hypothetical protein